MPSEVRAALPKLRGKSQNARNKQEAAMKIKDTRPVKIERKGKAGGRVLPAVVRRIAKTRQKSHSATCRQMINAALIRQTVSADMARLDGVLPRITDWQQYRNLQDIKAVSGEAVGMKLPVMNNNACQNLSVNTKRKTDRKYSSFVGFILS